MHGESANAGLGLRHRPGGFVTVVCFLAVLLLGLLSTNPLLTTASLALGGVLTALLWRHGEPPALLFAMGYHWLQASILVFYANGLGRPLSEMDYGPRIGTATWLTLAGVLVVAVGLRIGAGRNRGVRLAAAVIGITARLSIGKLFAATLLAIALSLAVGSVAFLVPGLAQPLLALLLVRWVMVYVFTFSVLSRHRGYWLLAAVFTLEVIIGFLGYFSGFKTVLVVMLLAALTNPAHARYLRLRTAAILAGLVLLLALVWTGIKTDYRDFLNQGTRQQVVLVPVGERVAKLADLVGELTPDKLASAVELLVQRLTYVYYFGKTLEAVPAYVAHEQGRLWREALMNSMVPRALNPQKRVIDDSERTATYTGLRVAGAEEGTSISLGYIAESYIDFGRGWMFLPLLLWGILVGRLYAWLMDATPYPLFGFASAAVLVGLGASVLEQSNLKMVASIMLSFIVLYAFQRLAGPGLLRVVAGNGQGTAQQVPPPSPPPGRWP